jgi:antitoxin HicB
LARQSDGFSDAKFKLRRYRIPPRELAGRIGKDEKEVRRILDPKHLTKLPALTVALRALGKRLVVGVAEAT